MNMRRILMGTLVVGIVGNAIDWLLNNYLWGSTFASLAWMNATPPIMWLVIGDFFAAFMLMVAWDKFGASMGRGPGAGFRFGLFAGAFVNFPAIFFWQMFIKDFPYAVAWQFGLVSVLWYGVAGAVAASLDGKTA